MLYFKNYIIGTILVMKCILGILIIFASTSLYAAPGQSLDILKNKIEQYVVNDLANYSEGKVQVKAEKIDPRLHLKACAEDQLEVFNPYQMPMLNTNTMGIKCREDTNHWILYVPIKITLLKTIFVAKHPLMKGTRVTEEDIYQTEMDVQKLKQGYFSDNKEVLGQVCKQHILADNPLTPYNIELPKLVQRGEQVAIIIAHDNLNISMDGIAINDGVLGETIKVKNLSSKRIVEAQVSGIKKVMVNI